MFDKVNNERVKQIHAEVARLVEQRSDVMRGWKNYALLPDFDMSREPIRNLNCRKEALRLSRLIVLAWATLPSNDKYTDEQVLQRLRIQLSLPVDGAATWNSFGPSDVLLHEASWELSVEEVHIIRRNVVGAWNEQVRAVGGDPLRDAAAS